MAGFLFSALATLSGEIQAAGSWGDGALLILFAVSAMSFVPRPALCVVAGAAYGYWGIPIALVGTTAGACAAFGIGYIFSARIAKLAIRRPVVMSLLDAVRSEGWRAVLLFRLSPTMPSSLQSVIFGLSKVSFAPYCLATISGILPGVLLEVTIGAAGQAAAQGHFARWQLCLVGIGVLAGLFATILVIRQARNRIRARREAPLG